MEDIVSSLRRYNKSICSVDIYRGTLAAASNTPMIVKLLLIINSTNSQLQKDLFDLHTDAISPMHIYGTDVVLSGSFEGNILLNIRTWNRRACKTYCV